MLKNLAKLAEKCAKKASTGCGFLVIIHQPKMPKALIKKD